MSPKQLIETVRAVLAAVEHGPGWISVKDHLPEGGADYLVFADAQIQIGEYFNVTRTWIDENMESIEPTHWMPLPASPDIGGADK